MSTQARPTGITILAVVAAIEGVLALLGGGLGFIGGASGFFGGSGDYLTLFSAGSLGLGIVALAVAYGFWTLKSWAWVIGAAYAIVVVVFGVLQFFIGNFAIVSVAINLVLAAIILWYLWQPSIQALFGRGK